MQMSNFEIQMRISWFKMLKNGYYSEYSEDSEIQQRLDEVIDELEAELQPSLLTTSKC